MQEDLVASSTILEKSQTIREYRDNKFYKHSCI